LVDDLIFMITQDYTTLLRLNKHQKEGDHSHYRIG